jgi:hypothetical protein
MPNSCRSSLRRRSYFRYVAGQVVKHGLLGAQTIREGAARDCVPPVAVPWAVPSSYNSSAPCSVSA